MQILPTKETLDPDYANLDALFLELLAMASTFDLKHSFAMIRAGHIDLTILGALEVASGVSVEEVLEKTEADVKVADDVKEFGI